MNKNKGKTIKSVVSLVATALVLIVATVAWFSSGTKVSVEGISADVETDGFSYILYEAVDANKNGLLDNGEDASGNWLPVSGPDINIDKAVPNQYRFFKAKVQVGSRTEINVKFTGIVVTDPVPEERADFLSLINVRFRTEDVATQPVPYGEAIDENMYQLFGSPAQGGTIPTEVEIYNLTDLTGHQNQTVEIYYTVGIDGNSFTDEMGDFTDKSVLIGAILFE